MGEPIKLSVKPLYLRERKKRRLEGLTIPLDDEDPKYFPSGDPHVILMKAAVPIDQRSAEPRKDQSTNNIPSDRSTVVLRSDRSTTDGQEGVEPWYYGQTVVPIPRHHRQTVALRFDGETVACDSAQATPEQDQTSIPLSELQWAAWQELTAELRERAYLQDLARKINQKWGFSELSKR